MAGFSAMAHDSHYSNASASDADYSDAGTSEAVKAHNRGLAHIQNLIIINVMHISMFRNYSFNFGQYITKRGKNSPIAY